MGIIEPLILQIILLASRAWDVEAPLIAAVIDAESSWNLHALGDYDQEGQPHSFGLMQLHDKGAGYGYPRDLLLNPAFNIFLGTSYLKSCMEQHPKNIKLAISAYNQGVEGAAKRGYGHNKVYVTNVLSLWEKYRGEWYKTHILTEGR